MRKFITPNRQQQHMMLTVNLDSAAPEGSPVRLLNDLVDGLDTTRLERQYNLQATRGQEPIHPKTLIKVVLFALHRNRFSLRKIEADTGTDLAYLWLTGNKPLDHSTVGNFLSRFCVELTELFAQVVLQARKHRLVDFELLAIDSVKVRANASYKQFRTVLGIKKETQRLRERLKELLSGAGDEQTRAAEAAVIKLRCDRLEAARRELAERTAEQAQGKTESEHAALTEREKINVTDHDCTHIQQANGETNAGYAVATATDGAHDIVTAVVVCSSQNDVAALLPTIDESIEQSGGNHEVVVADAGFNSKDNLEALEDRGQRALIPDRRLAVEGRNATSKGEYDRSKFSYHAETNRYRCPAGQDLSRIGTVRQDSRTYDHYANRAACQACPNREKCTRSTHRIISRDQNEAVSERMRTALLSETGKATYGRRAHAAEGPYGTLKHGRGFRVFHRRGRSKVTMEITLGFMLHNMLKIGRYLQQPQPV